MVHIRNYHFYDNGGLVVGGSGPLDGFLDDVYTRLSISYPKFYKMDRLSKLGFLAGESMSKTRDLATYRANEVAVVLSNASGSLDADIQYAVASKTSPSPALFVYTLPNIVIGELCIRHGLKGENAFLVTPEFDATSLHFQVERLMETTSTKACVAGWVEVLQEQHDVFLYLVEKQKQGLGREHSASELNKLYRQLWNN